MRRTLFGKSPELERITPANALAREALLFDVRDHEGSADQALAERRVGGWMFAPWLLLGGHLIITTALLLQPRAPATRAALMAVCIPLGLSLLTDVGAGLLMVGWRRMLLAPHTVARLMCGYIAATGMLWMGSSVAINGLQLRDSGFVTLAMASGFFVRSIIAIVSPPLAIISAAVAIVATALFA